jgi:hypothetical protein
MASKTTKLSRETANEGNPTHAAAASMTLLANEPFAFDPRLS